MKPPGEKMLALDFETTGLEPREHDVLEIGCVVVGSDLQPLDDGLNLVIHMLPATIKIVAQPDAYEMHTRNGLIEACGKSTLRLEYAEKKVALYLASHAGPRQLILLNNNTGFERKWLEHHLPHLNDYLHYRNIDVSSWKEGIRRRWPKLAARVPEKTMAHRGLADVRESLRELEFYWLNLQPVDPELR